MHALLGGGFGMLAPSGTGWFDGTDGVVVGILT